MQVTETLAEGLKREFTVVVPAGDIENKLKSRLSELAHEVNLPGFRPGKVPMTILRKRFGDSVKGEILEQTISDSWQKAMSEKEIRPANQPKIEIVTFEDGADLEYKLAVDLMPDIGDIDFGKIELEKLVAEIADDEIDAALQRIAESRKSFEAVEGREAQSGDQVLIDFIGRIGGEEFEGSKAEGYALEIGSGMFIAGFEEQLTGAKAGDKRDVTVNFPDDYAVKDLAGKEAVFEVTVKEVREPKLPPVADELAQGLGLENLEALRGSVREQMENEYGGVTRARLKRDLLDKLAETYSFDLPPTLLEQEFNGIWERVKEAIEKGTLEEDDKDKSEDELREEYSGIAERRVRLGVILSEVGRTNNITVSQEDLNRAMAEEARRYPGQERKVIEYFQQTPEAMQELHAPIFEDKVVDFMLEMAKVTEKKVPVSELLKADDASDEGAVDEAAADEKKGRKGKARKKS